MKIHSLRLAALCLALFAQSAAAHTGLPLDGSLLSGFAHPFSGLDHLLVMLGVGLWAATLPRALRLWPVASFLALMLLGAALPFAGMQFSCAEYAVAASVAAMGLLLSIASTQVSATLGVAAVGLFALAHGFVHGAEMPAASSPLVYGTGFFLATALLHGLGLALGSAALRFNASGTIRACGWITGGIGAWLLWSAY